LAGPSEQPQEMTPDKALEASLSPTALPPTIGKPMDAFRLNLAKAARYSQSPGAAPGIADAFLRQNAVENKPEPEVKWQKTPSGLSFNPMTDQTRDSTGRVLSTDEITAHEAKYAAQRAQAVASAQNKAKLDQFPPGSMDYNVEWSLQNGGKTPPGLSRNPVAQVAFGQAMKARAAIDGNPLAMQIAESRSREAIKPALDQTQKQLASNQGFLGTLDKNIASADQFAQRVGGDGSPAMNEIFNKWKRKVTGDPDVAAFDFWNNSITGEAAKIASGGVGSVSASSDAAIQHQRDVMNSAQNYKQWRAAANAMLEEGHNRIGQLTKTRDDLVQQSGSTSKSTQAVTPQAIHWDQLK